MRKLLGPKDILLLGLAGLLDVYEEVKDPFGVKAQSAKALYGFVPKRYKRHNFSRLVESRIKTGQIEKVTKNGEVYLRLTSAGRENIIRDFPIISFQKRKWDGKWRVVIFDISETDKKVRNSLRYKLKELGFGMLQESVWVTPHDVSLDFRQFVETHGLGSLVFVMEVSVLLAGDKNLLVNKVWGINAVHKRYWELLVKIENWKRMYVSVSDRKQKPTGSEVESTKKLDGEAREIKREYVEIMLADPMLPRELLPKGWLGGMVRREIKKVRI